LENISIDKIVLKWTLMTKSERVANYVLLARNRVQLHSVVKVKQSLNRPKGFRRLKLPDFKTVGT
jgi:hypothetical protein